MRIEIKKKKCVPTRYYWQIVANNGIVILKSRKYFKRQAAMKSASKFGVYVNNENRIFITDHS